MQREVDARPGRRMGLEDRCQAGPGEVVRHAEPHGTLGSAAAEVGPDGIVEGDEPARLREEAFAGGRRPEAASGAVEQGSPGQGLEPGDLLADGALGEVQGLGRRRHAPPVGRGGEGAEQGNIEVAGHRSIMNPDGPHHQH